MHSVDLGESFRTHIFLQNLASIQPRTSPLKFAASLVEDRLLPGLAHCRPASGSWLGGEVDYSVVLRAQFGKAAKVQKPGTEKIPNQGSRVLIFFSHFCLLLMFHVFIFSQ